MKEQVLKAMREAGKPDSAGEVTTLSEPTARKWTRHLPN